MTAQTTQSDTPAAALLAELTAMDIRLAVDGIVLNVDAPKGTLTPQLLDTIRRHRRELIHLLRCQGPCDGCGRHQYVDTPIHGGRSIRRDCERCGRTWGFPVWNPPPDKFIP